MLMHVNHPLCRRCSRRNGIPSSSARCSYLVVRAIGTHRRLRAKQILKFGLLFFELNVKERFARAEVLDSSNVRACYGHSQGSYMLLRLPVLFLLFTQRTGFHYHESEYFFART